MIGRRSMKAWLRAVASLAIIGAISPAVSAQWPRHPTNGVPKTADGTPDLTGPAPRTADGKPDFSGNWQRGDGQLGPAGGGTLSTPAPAFSVGPPVTTFRDVGANVTGGLPLQPWAAELVKARRAENSKDNPDAHCLPMGLHAVSQSRPAAKDDSDPGTDRHCVRGQLRSSLHFHGRPHAARRATRNHGGTGTPSGSGRATRSSWKRPVSGTMGGSTSSAIR